MDAIITRVDVNGKHIYVFRPYPPYVMDYEGRQYYCDTLSDVRTLQIPEDIKDVLCDIL